MPVGTDQRTREGAEHATSTTDRAAEQARSALKKANRARSERARLRATLRASTREEAAERVASLITTDSPEVRSMMAWELLGLVWSSRRCSGSVRVERAKQMMRRVGIDPWATVGRLTQRQRDELADRLREVAA